MMIKLALAAAALTAAGTTAYVLHDARPTTAQATPAPAALATPAATPSPPRVTPPPALAPAPPSAQAAPVPRLPLPALAAPRLVDRATLERLGLERGPARGPADAPVTIAVFTDMQCRFCAMAIGALDQLSDDYAGKLRIVVKQMPVHETAELAAEAALAADAQGKFWELHDLMIANQDDLSRDALLGLAAQAGLDVARFRVALDQHAYAEAVAHDVAAAQALEVQGTPAFVINGRIVNGMQPIANLRAAIDAALADT